MKQIKLLLKSLVLVFSLTTGVYPQETNSTVSDFLSLRIGDFHEFSYNNSNKIKINFKLSETDRYENLNFAANQEKKKSTLFNDLIYFVGTAAIAAVVYILWPEDKAVTEKKLTFGKPPHP